MTYLTVTELGWPTGAASSRLPLTLQPHNSQSPTQHPYAIASASPSLPSPGLTPGLSITSTPHVQLVLPRKAQPLHTRSARHPNRDPNACGTMLPQRLESGAWARPRSLPLRNWSLASAAGLMPQRK